MKSGFMVLCLTRSVDAGLRLGLMLSLSFIISES